MAWEQNPYAIKITCSPDTTGMTQLANTNFSAPLAQFSFVIVSTNANPAGNPASPLVNVVTASTQRPIGVLQNAPKARYSAAGTLEGVDEAEVTIAGITKAIAGAAISAGAALSVNTLGQVVPVTFPSSDTTADTYFIVGTALTPAAAQGDLITIVTDCAAIGRAA